MGQTLSNEIPEELEEILSEEETIEDLSEDASPMARLLHKTRLVERDVKEIPRSGDHDGYDYKFIEDKVLTPIVAHAQRKHGIKTVFHMDDWEFLRPGPEAKPKRMVMWTVEVFLIEDPETKLEIPWVSEAFSHGDKGTSKAISQGRKDFYRVFYDIGGGPENENPDAETAQPSGAKGRGSTRDSDKTSDIEEGVDWSGATPKQINYLEHLQKKCKLNGLDFSVGDLEDTEEASEAITALQKILESEGVDY